MIAYDSCGRVRVSTFSFTKPTILSVSQLGNICGGYQVNITNPWKYNLQVTYVIRKCSDNSIVYSTTQLPQTTYYSPTYDLQYDTCYKFEAYNECGDTLRNLNYVRTKPIFGINACTNPACSVQGKGDIKLAEDYLTGIKPITFTIISGPEAVGTSVTQTAGASYVYMRNLALGTYTIEGVDACGQKSTITVVVDKPLQRKIDITYTPNCSGGQDVHVKVTSNYKTCVSTSYGSYGNQLNTHVASTQPGYNPINVTQSYISPTQSNSIWEADYINVKNTTTLQLRLFAYDGCAFDTTITITPYSAPVITSSTGYVCPASGIGLVNFNISGGRPPYQYRMKPSTSTTWGSWQTSNIFSGITVGTYDFNVVDACPNGSISTISFVPWSPTAIGTSPHCVNFGQAATLYAASAVEGVTYEWLFNGTVVGTGDTLKIASLSSTNSGTYTLRQTFPGSGCIENTSINYVECSALPLPIDGLTLYATPEDGNVRIMWQTFTENNTDHFEIQRSSDGNYFTTIGNNLAAGNSNTLIKYYFTDKNPGYKTVYYRIKAIDKDGKITYSNIAKVNFIAGKEIVVFPNPASEYVHIHAGDAVLLNMYNSQGQLVLSKNLKAGNNTIAIQNFSAGAYMMVMKEKLTSKLLSSHRIVIK